jgi:hypothetical protein
MATSHGSVPAMVFAAAMAVYPTASLQGTVQLRGRLVSGTGQPIPAATITLTGTGYSLKSDSAGRFVLSGTTGATLRLQFDATGFRRDSTSIVLGRIAIDRDFTLAGIDVAEPDRNPSASILRGRVEDESGQPLSYANVQLNGGRRYLSDDSGRFQLSYPNPGRSTVLVRRIGFAPAEVMLDAMPDTSLRIRMTAVATVLPELRITGRAAFVSLDLNGFYRRMREVERGATVGYFFTPEDFEFRKPTLMTNMAEGIPSVKVERRSLSPLTNVITGALGCTMTVYLDGVRVVGKLGGQDDFLNQLVNPYDVAAMEVYPRPGGAPPQYQSLNGRCGVVLIWTK